jgi:hypothetical protein
MKSVPPVDAPTINKIAQIIDINTPCTKPYTNNDNAF